MASNAPRHIASASGSEINHGISNFFRVGEAF